MEFEEGEVDDVSESELEQSPAFKMEDMNNAKKRPRYKHSKHHSKRKLDKESPSKSRHLKRPASSKVNGHSERTVHTESQHDIVSDHRHHHQHKERLSLKDYLSDEEGDTDLNTSKEKREGRHSRSENRHKKRRRRIERMSKPVIQMQCRYFMEGRCSKGDSCPFGHDFQPPKKQELCKFYAVGVCSKGSSCLYLHEGFPCKFYHLSGNCNHGDSCKFSHDRLTMETEQLLERIAGTKDPSISGERLSDSRRPTRCGPGSYAGFTDHGDLDYRFGQRPTRFSNAQVTEYECHSSPRLMCSTFHPNRQTVPGSNVEPRSQPCPRVPFNLHPMDRLERPRFGCENNFLLNAPTSNTFVGPGFPQPPISNPGIDGPYRSQLPISPLRLTPGERPIFMRPALNIPPIDVPGIPDFSRFRPPFCPPRLPPPVRPPFNPVPDEATVSSELDKIAALLACSKPPNPTTQCISPPSDPRAQSPTMKSDKSAHSQDDVLSNPEDPQTATPEGPSTPVRRLSLTLSSPELNVVAPRPASVTSPLHVQWRLLQLDMNVKIPYPLMQLPIEDLPHRFEDPRLRGQLTTLRPPTKPTASLNAVEDLIEPKTEENQISTETVVENADKSSTPSRRRPIKLQLNEMASTFANSYSALNAGTPTRSGDRSYLDDPRFRRRRIISANTTSQDSSDGNAIG